MVVDGTGETEGQLSPALLALQSLFSEMETSRQPVLPQHFCHVLGIPVLQQQDAQEFWKLLLPALKLRPLTDLYQGACEDYVKALDGSDRERRREVPFLDVSVEVPTTGSGSLLEALQKRFGEPELLSEAQGNGWRPEKNADKVDAHKGVLVRQQGLPSILQIHQKRFQFDWKTKSSSKINAQFRFPDVLDLTAVCTGQSGDGDHMLYDLQAVVIHVGTFKSGHYYSYVRPNPRSDKWYRFDDHKVERVQLKDVLCDGYGDHTTRLEENNKESFWGKLLSTLHPSKQEPHGFGGETANAYVLQYIRRSELPMLYKE